MRTRRHQLEFATFICKFGPKNLVDGMTEVVLPVFFSGRRRTYGATEYLFHQPALIDLPDGHSGIAFEFVKSTVLERQQVFDYAEGLREDEKSMPSAPSGIALLILDTHRLVFFPKTKHAPSLRELESTCRTLFVGQWNTWIREEAAKAPRRERRKRREQLAELLPRPEVTILPLSGAQQIEAALARFEVVKTLSVTLVDTNNEYDPNEFFKVLRAQQTTLASQTTRVQHSSAEGLTKSEVKKDVRAATQQGTARVQVKGIDHNGRSIKQENEDLSVRAPANFDAGEKPEGAASPMYEAFSQLVASGIVKAPAVFENVRNRVRSLLDSWKAR